MTSPTHDEIADLLSEMAGEIRNLDGENNPVRQRGVLMIRRLEADIKRTVSEAEHKLQKAGAM